MESDGKGWHWMAWDEMGWHAMGRGGVRGGVRGGENGGWVGLGMGWVGPGVPYQLRTHCPLPLHPFRQWASGRALVGRSHDMPA